MPSSYLAQYEEIIGAEVFTRGIDELFQKGFKQHNLEYHPSNFYTQFLIKVS